MTIFSKRNKPLPELYRYDFIDPHVRVQIVFILRGALGMRNTHSEGYSLLETAVEILKREYGVFQLTRVQSSYPAEEFERFIQSEGDIEKVLDGIEVIFRLMDKSEHNLYSAEQSVADAVVELNRRFREGGIGYSLENFQIIRISDNVTHSEIIVPAIRLLSDSAFANANGEFMSAFEHLRHTRLDECLNECLKSLESTLKIICDKKKWHYEPTKATSKVLIEICISNGLYHSFMQTALNNFRAFLESSVPTARNRIAGHGSGSHPIVPTEKFVEYILLQTALIIKYSIESI